MRVRLLPSAFGENAAPQYLTTFVINDVVALDAGCLGFSASRDEQRRVRDVFISHSHIDHLASLPIFLENVFTPEDECVTIHGSDTVLDVLRRDLFNDRIWPDFVELSKNGAPFLRLARLEARKPVRLAGLAVTPIPVAHIVPTHGFLVEEEDGAAAVFVTDTGPTDEIWESARKARRLKAVFLDASFPESQAALARESEHLTPTLFAAETKKLRRRVRWFAVHVKPVYRDQILAELEGLGLSGLEVAEPGKEYRL